MSGSAAHGDPLLARLVHAWDVAAEPASGPSLILHVGGMLLTGTLVPAQTWADAESEALRAALPGGADPESLVAADGDGLPTVIHLAGTRTLLPSGVLYPHTGKPWRGLLARVDGWSFGTIELGPSNRADDPPRVW